MGGKPDRDAPDVLARHVGIADLGDGRIGTCSGTEDRYDTGYAFTRNLTTMDVHWDTPSPQKLGPIGQPYTPAACKIGAYIPRRHATAVVKYVIEWMHPGRGGMTSTRTVGVVQADQANIPPSAPTDRRWLPLGRFPFPQGDTTAELGVMLWNRVYDTDHRPFTEVGASTMRFDCR